MKKPVFKFFYRKLILSLLALVTIFLFGCSITGKAAHESSQKPEIYFCPKDNCGNILQNNIKNADKSVYCAFYDLELKSVIAALANKSEKMDVKVVIDNENTNNLVRGVNVKFDDNRQLMHNKFCIIDGMIVITGSFNPTNNDNYNNNNNMLVIYSSSLSDNYKDEFDELWNRDFGGGKETANSMAYINGKKVENFFCPEDKCAEKVMSRIKDAKSSVYFMSFTFTHEGIADALLAKDNIDVKGIFDSGQSSSKYSQFKRLKEFGMDVKKDSNKHKLHHKVFIIDNRTVITGSFNPTASADTRNDENILIIDDEEIASLYLEEFDELWT